MVHKGGDDVLWAFQVRFQCRFYSFAKALYRYVGLSPSHSNATHLSDVPVRCIVVVV